MEETLRILMEEHKRWMQEQIDTQNQKFVEQQKQMVDQQLQMTQQHQQLMGQILEQLQNSDGRNLTRMGSGDQGVRNSVWFNPKIEFPCFDGSDPNGWTKHVLDTSLCAKLWRIKKLI